MPLAASRCEFNYFMLKNIILTHCFATKFISSKCHVLSQIYILEIQCNLQGIQKC